MPLHLKIITPRKIVTDEQVEAVIVPGSEGELTILPHHDHLLAMLKEGIITMRGKNKEDFLAIGAGYLETDGKNVNILVSQAYEQSEIDKDLTEQAIERAKKTLENTKDLKERQSAEALLRRSVVDLKLIKKRRRQPSI